MERDIPALNDFLPSSISTHTLTWSVTIKEIIVPINGYISTHTLTWSVTKTLRMVG